LACEETKKVQVVTCTFDDGGDALSRQSLHVLEFVVLKSQTRLLYTQPGHPVNSRACQKREKRNYDEQLITMFTAQDRRVAQIERLGFSSLRLGDSIGWIRHEVTEYEAKGIEP